MCITHLYRVIRSLMLRTFIVVNFIRFSPDVINRIAGPVYTMICLLVLFQ